LKRQNLPTDNIINMVSLISAIHRRPHALDSLDSKGEPELRANLQKRTILYSIWRSSRNPKAALKHQDSKVGMQYWNDSRKNKRLYNGKECEKDYECTATQESLTPVQEKRLNAIRRRNKLIFCMKNR
jgi:hypothetical protein